MDRPVLQIVVASTRPGRVGLPVSIWAADQIRNYGKFSVEVVDLAEVNLPFLDEPDHPRLRKYTKQHTKNWSATIERACAFVFVTPEYNFGFNAPLKNALDFLHLEWQYKPVGLVSYGGVAAGTRAVQMLKQVVTALKMVPLAEGVNIPFVAQLLSPEGQLKATDSMNSSLRVMLDELWRWTAALTPLRAPLTGTTS